jgi:hypothetical protein
MILILLAAAAVSGGEPPAAKAVQPAASASAAAKDPMVCKVDPRPNSRIPSTICMRKSQADQMARDAATNLERMQSVTGNIKAN